MSDCSNEDSSSYRDILGSILDSTECKIDSARSQDLRKLVEDLCTTRNDKFM